MVNLGHLWRRVLHYLRRERFDRELEEEVRFHLEMKAEEYVAAGMSPVEALRAARRSFGNETRVREISRETWGFGSMETLLQDLRYGAHARQEQGLHSRGGYHARARRRRQLTACYVPARRATRIDPLIALRYE